MHILISVADFRTADGDEQKEIIAKLAKLYLPSGNKRYVVDWNALMDKSPALFTKMTEHYLEIVRKFDEALSLFDHNDVFCKQCRIRRISNAIYKGKITVFVGKHNDACMKFVDNDKEYTASLVLGNYSWMKQKDKEDKSLEEKSLFGLNMTPRDPFEDTTEEALANFSLEVLADRIDLIFSHWRDANLDKNIIIPFYRMLNMILEDESLCIQSDNCPEIKKCRNIMVKNQWSALQSVYVQWNALVGAYHVDNDIKRNYFWQRICAVRNRDVYFCQISACRRYCCHNTCAGCI
jgi:hypothetical protein